MIGDEPAPSVARRRVALAAVGNELMGDDGAGPAVLRRLAPRWDGHPDVLLRVLDGDLLELGDLASAASTLLVVDAALDVPVGAVRLRRRPAARGPAASPHQSDVVTTLRMLERLDMPAAFPAWQLWSIGITQPRELGASMTPIVHRATARAARLLHRVLQDLIAAPA